MCEEFYAFRVVHCETVTLHYIKLHNFITMHGTNNINFASAQ